MAAVAAATEALQRRWDSLEKELDGRDHLCDRFTVADVMTYLVIGFASILGVGVTDRHPNLQAWVERVRARPTVGREFDAMTRAAATV
jgi:glutathione S-transferase